METALTTRVRYLLDGELGQTDEGAAFEKVVKERNEYNVKLVADGKEPLPLPQVSGKQSFKTYSVETDEDFSVLVPDATERTTLINRALGLKQANHIRGFMLSDDEDFAKMVVEGVIDLADVCAKPAERKVMSKEAKRDRVMKDLGSFSDEEIKALFESILTKTAA